MLTFLLLACAPHPGAPRVHADPHGVLPAGLATEGIALSPVVLVSELPAPPLPADTAPGIVEAQLENAALPSPTLLDPVRDAAFLRGEYVGNIRFGGGVIHTGTVALNARARLIEFNQQAEDAEQARRWLGEAVREAIEDRHLPFVPLTTTPDVTVERVNVRGVSPDDGHDNANIPRVTLRPLPLPAEPSAAQRYVLVPLLHAYYSHNGGWFIGQEYGCMAGARIETTVVLYDAHTGAPVWWLDALGQHLDAATATPNTAQLDQYLLWAEADVEAALARELLR